MPGSATDARAAALLRRFRTEFGETEPPIPVEAIAQDLVGLRIAETEGLDCSGLLVPAERRIWVNAREAAESPATRRFTIAHELGHWVCHVLEGRWRPAFCRTAGALGDPACTPLEREANVFAASLLMPEENVRDEFAQDRSLGGLAERFGVSQDAMRWRLADCGLE